MPHRLKRLELTGFKSFAKKTNFIFDTAITSIVGPNGSGKSNCAEAFRWVLGERSLKSLRGQRGEDLIFSGPAAAGRLNRAAVEVVFANADRRFNLDFPEVAIRREVYRDGSTGYFLNGSAVRFRDIVELLAAVSLSAAEHFIIGQGEADQILRASESERRQLVEDALGLRLYHFKIEASEKKLTQTEANVAQAQSLRREIAPHLRFLKKQIERIEQAERLRAELQKLYRDYLLREETYLTGRRKDLAAERQRWESALAEREKKLKGLGEVKPFGAPPPELLVLESEQKRLAREREELNRRLGNLEGKLETAGAAAAPAFFSAAAVGDLAAALRRYLAEADQLFNLEAVKNVLRQLRSTVDAFFRQAPDAAATAQSWQQERQDCLTALAECRAAETKVADRRRELLKNFEQDLAGARARQESLFAWRGEQQEFAAALKVVAVEEEKLAVEEENFKRELAEGRVLVGTMIEEYRRQALPAAGPAPEPRPRQEERRRGLERLKIKLEDLGGESDQTLKEYREVSERDEFLAKEIADLEHGALALRNLIADLRHKLDQEFRDGLTKINRYFKEFVELMFGGGQAALLPVNADLPAEETEAAAPVGGLDIKISLPRKRIKNLLMLSGGERSLVSIALLFALSQVNPPPFLVLDETDAALDEANSKKYADLIEDLAKRSQLILITHNRETMSRAAAIYGVTMSGDGVSQLLSIKLDEAVVYAK